MDDGLAAWPWDLQQLFHLEETGNADCCGPACRRGEDPYPLLIPLENRLLADRL